MDIIKGGGFVQSRHIVQALERKQREYVEQKQAMATFDDIGLAVGTPVQQGTGYVMTETQLLALLNQERQETEAEFEGDTQLPEP